MEDQRRKQMIGSCWGLLPFEIFKLGLSLHAWCDKRVTQLRTLTSEEEVIGEG